MYDSQLLSVHPAYQGTKKSGSDAGKDSYISIFRSSVGCRRPTRQYTASLLPESRFCTSGEEMTNKKEYQMRRKPGGDARIEKEYRWNAVRLSARPVYRSSLKRDHGNPPSGSHPQLPASVPPSPSRPSLHVLSSVIGTLVVPFHPSRESWIVLQRPAINVRIRTRFGKANVIPVEFNFTESSPVHPSITSRPLPNEYPQVAPFLEETERYRQAQVLISNLDIYLLRGIQSRADFGLRVWTTGLQTSTPSEVLEHPLFSRERYSVGISIHRWNDTDALDNQTTTKLSFSPLYLKINGRRCLGQAPSHRVAKPRSGIT
ncbi:hypothetical protein L218DRAFT_949981 [Marasmius fiardii PR-910]|nr:hypothetical protein L218DRAFT_949981 [Marasmius fiardii PR-910]